MEEFLRTSDEIPRLDLPVIESGSDQTMFDYMVDKDGKYRNKLRAVQLTNMNVYVQSVAEKILYIYFFAHFVYHTVCTKTNSGNLDYTKSH